MQYWGRVWQYLFFHRFTFPLRMCHKSRTWHHTSQVILDTFESLALPLETFALKKYSAASVAWFWAALCAIKGSFHKKNCPLEKITFVTSITFQIDYFPIRVDTSLYLDLKPVCWTIFFGKKSNFARSAASPASATRETKKQEDHT